ncbi:MAG: DUF560 domain-containing protein [Alphaproteobacteria bacterium]|nr:DUF560 domain-containing protein [Alphaproteobacteria bacterium]
MLKKLLLFFSILFMPIVALAEKNIIMSPIDVVKLAGDLVYAGKYDSAQDILVKMPQTNNGPVEIERWYLLAQIEQRKGNIDEAIKIYRKILDDQPDLTKIRYELALCYMEKKQWYRADYNLRLAMAGKDIPDNIKQAMMYYRYVVRQNKNWNVWFNFGAAPDTNVNQAVGGRECIIVDSHGTQWCRDLPEPESVVGKNFLLGGNYEFKLSDNWRWKNDAMIYMNIYDKHDYDDLFLSASSGPRYVWDRGDVWLSGVINRRWYGWERYNWSYGGKLNANYDFTRKFSGGLTLRTMKNIFDEYGDYMDGYTYSATPYVSYSLNSTKYFVLRGNVDKETAKADAYANNRYGFSVGFGSVLPYGFNIYLEPNFSWTRYQGDRVYVKHHIAKVGKEKDFFQRYSISLSNSKFDIWGFVPTITVSYTNKDSNIPSREYEKWTAEITMQQRF